MHLFKGRVIKLKTQKRRLPNGRIANLEIIEHPGASLIVPFLSRSKIIFIRQYRPVVQKYLYELPTGTIDPGESPLVCAKREIQEEAGYAASRIVQIGKIHPVPGYSTEVIFIFKAEGLKRKSLAADPDEIIEIRVLDRAAFKVLFKKGQITDAKTICALVFCGWL